MQKPKSHLYVSKVHDKVFSRYLKNTSSQIYSICTFAFAFAFAFAFKFKYIFAHAHSHAQMYLHSHMHVHSHSLACAVHIFTCAYFQCIRIRVFIFSALLNCCFCSIYLDIHSPPQNILLEKFFATKNLYFHIHPYGIIFHLEIFP